jgi:hypothetical protein
VFDVTCHSCQPASILQTKNRPGISGRRFAKLAIGACYQQIRLASESGGFCNGRNAVRSLKTLSDREPRPPEPRQQARAVCLSLPKLGAARNWVIFPIGAAVKILPLKCGVILRSTCKLILSLKCGRFAAIPRRVTVSRHPCFCTKTVRLNTHPGHPILLYTNRLAEYSLGNTYQPRSFRYE